MINIDNTNPSKFQESLLSLDEYQKPKVVKDKDAIFYLLVRLLLLEPGRTDQTHPEMGIGIVSGYRYSYTEDLPQLEAECAKQISTYLPDLGGADVKISTNQDNELLINITINNTLYQFKTDSKRNTILPLDSLI